MRNLAVARLWVSGNQQTFVCYRDGQAGRHTWPVGEYSIHAAAPWVLTLIRANPCSLHLLLAEKWRVCLEETV